MVLHDLQCSLRKGDVHIAVFYLGTKRNPIQLIRGIGGLFTIKSQHHNQFLSILIGCSKFNAHEHVAKGVLIIDAVYIHDFIGDQFFHVQIFGKQQHRFILGIGGIETNHRFVFIFNKRADARILRSYNCRFFCLANFKVFRQRGAINAGRVFNDNDVICRLAGICNDGLIIFALIIAIPVLSPLLAPGAAVQSILGTLIGTLIANGNVPVSLALPALFAISVVDACDFVPVAASLGEADPDTARVATPAMLFSRFVTAPIAVLVGVVAGIGLFK